MTMVMQLRKVTSTAVQEGEVGKTFMTTILSESMMVESLWATVTLVLCTLFRTVCIDCSVKLSKALVASCRR